MALPVSAIQTVGGDRGAFFASGIGERVKQGLRHCVRSCRFGDLGEGRSVREDTSAGAGLKSSWEDVGGNGRMSRGGPASWCPDQLQLLFELTTQPAHLFKDLLARLA